MNKHGLHLVPSVGTLVLLIKPDRSTVDLISKDPLNCLSMKFFVDRFQVERFLVDCENYHKIFYNIFIVKVSHPASE